MPVLKLPRLPINWDKQPEMLRRYWDQTMSLLEDVGAFFNSLSSGVGINFNKTTGVIALDTTSPLNTDHSAVAFTAGDGLIGGGNLTASRTFSVGPGPGIVVGVDNVSVSTTLAAYDSGDVPSAFTLSVVDSPDAASWRTAIGAGTVTSVGLSAPSIFSVSGSPISSSGTLAFSLTTQPANTFLSAPNGSTGVPSFRGIVAADIPTLNQNTTGQAGSVANTLTFNNSGSGAASGAGYNGSTSLTISYNTIGAQPALVSGTNIKTVNGSSLLGSGNLTTGIRSTGQQTLSSTTTLGAGHKGANILILTSGITITFPSSGFSSGEGVLLSNISGGSVTLAFPGGSDMGTTLPSNGSVIALCDGGGFWRQHCYSTSRL